MRVVDKSCVAVLLRGEEGEGEAIKGNEFCHFSIQIGLPSKLIEAAVGFDKNHSLHSCRSNFRCRAATANADENMQNKNTYFNRSTKEKQNKSCQIYDLKGSPSGSLVFALLTFCRL